MRNGIFLIIIFFIALALNGCDMRNVFNAGPAAIKTTARTNYHKTSCGKIGVSRATSVLGLFSTGDCSIKAAAAAGNIQNIKYVDYTARNILGIYAEYTTTAFGD